LNSLNATSVLAWYTDVTHEIKPITSGHRLALSYNLIHTTDSLRPSLTMEKAAADRLRHTFLSWKQNVDLAAPEKLLYLLEHEYTQASLSASAMKGKDVHVLSLLSGLADEVGFNLGLASVEHTVIGGAEGDVWDGMNVTMDEAREWSTKIDCFVDLDGSELRAFDDFDAETEAIPNELTRTIEEGEYDEQDYEGYTGNVSCKHRITWQVLTRCQEGGDVTQCMLLDVEVHGFSLTDFTRVSSHRTCHVADMEPSEHRIRCRGREEHGYRQPPIQHRLSHQTRT
jgi:hypothetical protein